MGPGALLVEVSDLAEVMALHARLTAAPPAGVVDIVPAAATVLVRVDPVVLSLAATRTWVATAATSAATPASAPAPVTLPIRYDGDDLDDLAAALGVSPAQVSRWRRGQGIDPDNAERLDLLELVMSSLLRLYEPETAEKWLFGLNPLLRHRRPIDVIRQGRPEELLGAIRQEQADSYA